jgi:predicted AAA+ superfamily ATPase
MLDSVFMPNNFHHQSIGLFESSDPNLRRLVNLQVVYENKLLLDLPDNIPGIYSVAGGRQVGKTTLLKQWMLKKLKSGIAPDCLFFLSGELIRDHFHLINIIQAIFAGSQDGSFLYLILDEVTYIKDWDKGIKYLADIGLFEQSTLILTGSDLSFIKEARMRFPGRRGKADVVDFHLYPLTFKETIEAKRVIPPETLETLLVANEIPDDTLLDQLYHEFNRYLFHGGFLTAINDLCSSETILPATLATYSDWVRGDMLKRGKKEQFVSEILGAVIQQQGSQTTWNSFAGKVSVEHHQTIADYIDLLERMEVLFVQRAVIEDKRLPAPKKARKVHFTDPFIFHCINAWLNPSANPFERIMENTSALQISSLLAESAVANHIKRSYPCYYIKSAGEVDVAYVADDKLHPVEVKWTNQIRPGELKQIRKYPNGLIVGKHKQKGEIDSIPYCPLPLYLLRW